MIRFITVLVVMWALPVAWAQERTSETDPQLKAAIKQFPQADANKDGVLTWTEALAHRKLLLDAARPKPTAADLKYGPHERNVLDLWLADGAGARPLVVFIHGGGWLGGDKTMLSPDDLKQFINAGISVASINYRFSKQAPFPAPMRDAGLAIQYLRHHAATYEIDPKRVAAYGVSAGGVTSLWLAFHEDFADPSAADPILRQSTRLTCVGSIVGPATVDKQTMDEWFGMKVVTHPALLPFFNVQTEEELYSDAVRQVAAEASPINHLSKDDPPIFLDYPQDLAPLPAVHTPGDVAHHPLFGAKLKEAADKIGVECVFQAKNRPQQKYKGLVGFLMTKLAD